MRSFLDEARPTLEREVAKAINIAITQRADDIVLRVGELRALRVVADFPPHVDLDVVGWGDVAGARVDSGGFEGYK